MPTVDGIRPDDMTCEDLDGLKDRLVDAALTSSLPSKIGLDYEKVFFV